MLMLTLTFSLLGVWYHHTLIYWNKDYWVIDEIWVGRSEWWTLTVHGGQHDSGVIVGDDVGVAVFRFVHLHVGVLPGELLTRINGLERGARKEGKRKTDCEWRRGQNSLLWVQFTELSLASLSVWTLSRIPECSRTFVRTGFVSIAIWHLRRATRLNEGWSVGGFTSSWRADRKPGVRSNTTHTL